MMERIDMEEMWGYVAANAGADTLKLMLKSEPDLPFDKRFAVMQNVARKRETKFPNCWQTTVSSFQRPSAQSNAPTSKWHSSMPRCSSPPTACSI